MADEKDIIAQDKQAQEEYIPQGQAQELVDALNGEKSTFPYVTASSCNPVGAVVPTKLAYETYDALKVFFDQDIDTAEFVKEKLVPTYAHQINLFDQMRRKRHRVIYEAAGLVSKSEAEQEYLY